jgi:hypothetical protein
MKLYKHILLRSLKLAFIIESILTLVFIFIASGIAVPIHSEIFGLLFMSLFTGLLTLKVISPGLFNTSFILTLVISSVIQLIYLWIIIFAIFVLVDKRKKVKSVKML